MPVPEPEALPVPEAEAESGELPTGSGLAPVWMVRPLPPPPPMPLLDAAADVEEDDPNVAAEYEDVDADPLPAPKSRGVGWPGWPSCAGAEADSGMWESMTPPAWPPAGRPTMLEPREKLLMLLLDAGPSLPLLPRPPDPPPLPPEEECCCGELRRMVMNGVDGTESGEFAGEGEGCTEAAEAAEADEGDLAGGCADADAEADAAEPGALVALEEEDLEKLNAFTSVE